jgi:branched-chain amino acid transport system ATP-binding protein
MPTWGRSISLLKVERLSTYYGDIQVLYDISLFVKEGELVTLVGANGAGKTTLINSLSGITKFITGQVEFAGVSLEKTPPYERVELGLVQIPEGRMLFPFMTVQENLELGAFSKKARREKDGTLEKIYQLFPVLKDRRTQLAGSLSGGEQQMCAIARGLMAKPQMVMLDEPTLGLAPILVKETFGVVQQLKKEKISILLVEQNVRHSLQISDRGYVLEVGRIVLEGPSQELLHHERLRKAYIGI